MTDHQNMAESTVGSPKAAAVSAAICHNPACGTSRDARALIRNARIESAIIEYAKTPLRCSIPLELLETMNAQVRDIFRRKNARRSARMHVTPIRVCETPKVVAIRGVLSPQLHAAAAHPGMRGAGSVSGSDWLCSRAECTSDNSKSGLANRAAGRRRISSIEH